MKARRKTNGVIWDLSPEYLERYKNDFELLEEEVEEYKEEEVVPEPPKPVQKKKGRPKKEVAKR